jgi:multicomponent Na+:H+ antiporter subunit D
MAGAENVLVLGPIVIPWVGAAICMLSAHYNRMQRIIALVAGILACLCSLAVLAANLQPQSVGVQVYRLGGWMAPFGIVFVADKLAALLCVMSSLVIVAGLLYCLQCRDQAIKFPIFMPAFLCMSTGLHGALYTGDIFTFFVFLELMVMSSVVIVAISDNKLGLEAAIKYIFISGIGSVLLLLGIAALYTTFGTLNLAQVAQALSTGDRPLLALPAAVMIMCAFLVKSAVFPFHFWQPDFHTTAPTPLSAMLSSVVVKVGIYGIIRNNTLFLTQEAPLIQNILIVLGVIGIFFGGLSALRTWNAKRMLAYSTLGQVGFILVAIGWGSELALVAAIIYIFNHAFIKSGLLMITGVLASRNPRHSANLNELMGAGKGLTAMSILYLVGGLALAGIPPLNGFMSKIALVRSGADVENWAILGIVVAGGLLTLLYVTRTWQLIFVKPAAAEPEHDEHLHDQTGEHPHAAPHGDSLLAPALLICACILLGVFANPLVSVAQDTAAQVLNPAAYTCAVLTPSIEAGIELPEGAYDCAALAAEARTVASADSLDR